MPTKSEESNLIDDTFLQGLETVLREHSEDMRETKIRMIQDSVKSMVCGALTYGGQKLNILDKEFSTQMGFFCLIITAAILFDLKNMSQKSLRKERREIFFELLEYRRNNIEPFSELIQSELDLFSSGN